MHPKSKQLDLFGQVLSKNEPVLLQPSLPEENQAIEILCRSPTKDDQEMRIFEKSKERAIRLREMSRTLSSKSNQSDINQDLS